jgi:hypothetical protein
MQHSRIITGKLIGPRTVQLNEPAVGVTAEVEVTVHSSNGNGAPSNQTLAQFIQKLPEGTRSKDDIDRQISIELTSCGDR